MEHHDVSKFETSQLMEKAGLVHYEGARFYTLLPLGMKVFNSLQEIIRSSALKEGFQEILLPKIQPTRLLRDTGRLDAYVANIFRLSPEFGDFSLSRTNEETITNLVHGNLFNRHLPLGLFQFGEVFSHNTPSGGLISTSEFQVFEAYSFHSGEEDSREKVDSFKRIMKDLCLSTHLDLKYVESEGGNYGNFLLETERGQHKMFLCEGGHFTEYDEQREGCIVCGEDVEIQKGLGVSMFKIFDDSFSRGLNLKFRGSSNEEIYPFLATYGIGMSRLIYSIVDTNLDEEGIVWPEAISPFDFYLIPQYHSDPDILARLADLERGLEEEGMQVLVDDRSNAKVNSKIKISRFLGVPKIILVTPEGLRVQERKSPTQKDSTLEEILD